MNSKEKRSFPYQSVIKLMRLQHKALSEVGASFAILDAYSAVLRYLERMQDDEISVMLSGRGRGEIGPARRAWQPNDFVSSSLDEIENLMADESAPRNLLEAIAVGRFQVPQGSLKSIGSKDNLRNKISTMIQNEKVHQTIRNVARLTKP